MKWGKDAKQLQALADAGKDVPAIDNRPIMIGYEWIWDAFFEDLVSCRSIGMGAGPIPWTAIQKYCEVHRLNVEESYMLNKVVRHLDEIWMEHQHTKTASEMGKSKQIIVPKSRPARRR